ncbi:MAG: SWIM zinc finger family protein [Bacilli bacterium]|nr:SWIM zinc finger family protein [Bacilli bacterium]
MNDKLDYGEVKIDGRIISSSWWGQMWCRNIENYSDLRNRLERGRTYIRQNTVKNLSISSNCAESLVQGHSKEPYKVIINIKTIDKNKYDNILNTCENSVDNLESLMTGSFPKEYQQFFTDEEYGLFPKSNEIDYNCTCLDYLTNMHMCKHIAATMYAIGNKLDKDPLIFFKLRGIDLTEFTKKIVKKENEYVWDKINSESDRKISDNDISSLFGVDYEDDNEKIDVNKILYSDTNSANKELLNQTTNILEKPITDELNEEQSSEEINEIDESTFITNFSSSNDFEDSKGLINSTESQEPYVNQNTNNKKSLFSKFFSIFSKK